MGIMMMTIVLVLSPNYPVMRMKNEKQKKTKKKAFYRHERCLLVMAGIILFWPPALWMGVITFCQQHLRISCPDLPPK